MSARLKSAVPDTVRADVLAAEACTYCGDLLGPFEVDHVRPLSRGGTNDRANLACSCVSCNTQKSNHLLHEWRQWREANGMTWPPIASHPTEEIHYQTGCHPCMTTARGMADHDRALALTRQTRTAPYVIMRAGDRYFARYRCAVCQTMWSASYLIDRSYYSDCPCGYCTTSRLEAAS
jgi:hypothetical protein